MQRTRRLPFISVLNLFRRRVADAVRHDSHMARPSSFSVFLVVAAFICLSVFTSCESRSSKISRCHLNLMQLEVTKDVWAANESKSTNDTPSWEDLRPYFPGTWSNSIPTCPAGGTYTIGPV